MKKSFIQKIADFCFIKALSKPDFSFVMILLHSNFYHRLSTEQEEVFLQSTFYYPQYRYDENNSFD